MDGPRKTSRPIVRSGRSSPAASTIRTSCSGRAAATETKRSARPRSLGERLPGRRRRTRRDRRDRRAAAARERKAQRDRVLGEAVDRHQRLAAQAVGREALREALEGVGVHRLGAVQAQRQDDRSRPSRACSGMRFDAQLVGEVGRGRKRAAPVVDRPEPALGARQEGQRREQGDGQRRRPCRTARSRSGPCRGRAAASSPRRRSDARRGPRGSRGCSRAGCRA